MKIAILIKKKIYAINAPYDFVEYKRMHTICYNEANHSVLVSETIHDDTNNEVQTEHRINSI